MSNQTITPSLEPLPPGNKPSRHTFDLVESLGKLARVQVFQIVLVLDDQIEIIRSIREIKSVLTVCSNGIDTWVISNEQLC